MMSKQYDRAKVFELISESYQLRLTAAEYCRQKQFPVKVFYRYRQRYVAIYGTQPMPNSPTQPDDFVELAVSPSMTTGLSLEVGSHICLRFDSLPDPIYLSNLLSQLSDVTLK